MSDDVGWRDHLAGHRMTVDREFADRVRESALTSQQWELVMTAVEFEVEHPDDERARLVADTGKLDQVLPAMTKFDDGRGPAGALAGQQGASDGDEAPGLLDRVRNIFGGDSDGGDDELRSEAERLAGEYADRLQERLESEDDWERIRQLAGGD